MKQKSPMKLWVLLLTDLLAAVIILLSFAYFHHVRPAAKNTQGAPMETVVIQPPSKDVRFTYGVVGFENSSRVRLEISAGTDKEITASTFFVRFDSSKLTYDAVEAGEGMLCDMVTVRQDGDMLTVSADIDGSTPYLFRSASSSDVSASDGGQTGTALSILFTKADGAEVSVSDFELSVNPARLLTTSNELATYSLSNGESVINTSGDFGGRFPDKFTDGEVIENDNLYMNDKVNVSYSVKTVATGERTTKCHVLDIYVRSYEYFRTAIYEDRVDGGYNQRIRPLALANENNAIAAINGDYCTARDVGVVVRNGVIYRTAMFKDILVMYTDGTMKAFEEGTYTDMDFSVGDVWQIWSFGPSLLTADGQPKTDKGDFNSTVFRANPRSAIGYFEPGHYCLLTVDGRGADGSLGLTLAEMSQFFYDLGCTAAYNLDGGKTSTAVFGGKVVNNPVDGGRPSSDIVYIPRD